MLFGETSVTEYICTADMRLKSVIEVYLQVSVFKSMWQVTTQNLTFRLSQRSTMMPLRRCSFSLRSAVAASAWSGCANPTGSPLPSRGRSFADGPRGINAERTLDLTFLDDIFHSDSNSKQMEQSYDVILLNSPNSGLIPKLCRHSNTVICADGGANSLFESMGSTSLFVPQAIVGDLDSIKPNVLDCFVERGAASVCIRNQDENDFQKSLHYLLDQHTASQYVICWGAFGDRFDHEMQSFNVLYRHYQPLMDSHPHKMDILLMADRNLAVLLSPGKHRIKCAKLQGPFCGVIPLYSPARVSTRGLKYDMDHAALGFGGLISSSNGIEAADHCVDIETDEIIIFHTTCQL